MIIELESFVTFQKVLKDFKNIISKSPLAGNDAAKDLGGLLTADDTTNQITLEIATKGFYLQAVVPGEIKDPGKVVVRVDSITGLKASLGASTLSSSEGDKVLRLKSGRFKADIPVNHDTSSIEDQRHVFLEPTHSIHVNKLSSALRCVDLETPNDDTLFAKFVLNAKGLTVWSNNPSTAALYSNAKAAFESDMEVVLPVDFISSYLGKVTGKIRIAINESVFQLMSDEINIIHPLKEADVFDIQSSLSDILADSESTLSFSSKLQESIDSLTSILGFAPDDFRMNVIVDSKKNLFVCKTQSEFGEGENSFSITDPTGSAKVRECSLNCKAILRLLESMKALEVEDIVWYFLEDRILLRNKEGTINYICAQME